MAIFIKKTGIFGAFYADFLRVCAACRRMKIRLCSGVYFARLSSLDALSGRKRAVINAERVRAELRQAANKSGDADEPCAQGGKQRRLAAPVRRNHRDITYPDRHQPVFFYLKSRKVNSKVFTVHGLFTVYRIEIKDK